MLSLSIPMPLPDAIAHLSARTPIGSVLRSKAWKDVPLQLRQSAQFSAGVESARLLSMVQDKLLMHLSGLREQVANGAAAVDRSSFIGDLKALSKTLDLGVGPEDRGSLRDIRSASRLGMIFDIQTGQARGFAGWKIDQDEDVLDAWPAQELVRLEGRRVPRNWRARWAEAGGELTDGDFTDGRMIALKTDPIWMRISRFGTPWPPFDFQSGMGLQDIGRDEAEALGLIAPDERLEPQTQAFTDHLEASVQGIPEPFRRALKRFFGDQIDITGDTVRWVSNDQSGSGVPPLSPIANSNSIHDAAGRFGFGARALNAPDTGGGSGGENAASSYDRAAQKAKGDIAIQKILVDKQDVVGAMDRENLGPVDFRWGVQGDPDRKFKGGSGIAKIDAKHGRWQWHCQDRCQTRQSCGTCNS